MNGWHVVLAILAIVLGIAWSWQSFPHHDDMGQDEPEAHRNEWEKPRHWDP